MAMKNPKRPTGKGRPPYQVHVLGSWEEFLEVISDSPYSNWAFRGQGDAMWPLLSALPCYFVTFHIHPDGWQAQESRILRIFKRITTEGTPGIPGRSGERL
jgi:hypothetical protein